MKSIRDTIALIFILALTNTLTFAQSNPYGETSPHDKSSNDNHNSPHRHCTQPYSNKFFNRDYAGLGNSNMYHLGNELRSYVKYRCLTSEQIRRLTVLLQTDRDKYDFLIYALYYVYDIENYAMTGSVLANRNARDGFYRFLVKEGIPAGDYYNDYYAGAYNYPPAVYAQPPRPNPSNDNSYNNYPDPRNNNQNSLYNNPNQTPQYNNQNPQYNNPNQTPQHNNGQVYPDINSKGINAGYQGLMTYQEFAAMKDRIKQNTLENGKLETAKEMTQENVLTAIQVAEITRLFTFDNNRLEFAKFAYENTYDRSSYNVVMDAIGFQKNKEALQRYIQGKR